MRFNICKKILFNMFTLTMAALILFSGCSEAKIQKEEKNTNVYGVAVSDIDEEKGIYRKPISKGVQNSILRARQMYELRWTALDTIDSYYTEDLKFIEGVEYMGIPYGQPVHTGSYVGFSSTIAESMQAFNDVDSLMYTEKGTYNYSETSTKYSPYYSNDCSAYISYIWGLSGRFTTSMIAERTLRPKDDGYDAALFQYVGYEIKDMEVGYALNKGGSHVILVYDIVYDSNDEIIQVTTLEQTPPYIRLRIWGAGGNAGSLDDLQNMINGSGYEIIRYTGIDNVTYEKNEYVPLEAPKRVNNISSPISDTKNDAQANGKAYVDTGDFVIEGWAYSDSNIVEIKYSINGGAWKTATIEEYAGVTKYSASENFDGKDTLSITIKGVDGNGEYIIGTFDVAAKPKDYSYKVCFSDIDGEKIKPTENIVVEFESNLGKPSESYITFEGWSMCSQKVIGFEYKIDDGIWNDIESDFNRAIFEKNEEYSASDAYNSFKGGVGLGHLEGDTAHKIYIRGITQDKDVYEIAEISFTLEKEGKNVSAKGNIINVHNMIIIGVSVLGAIVVVVVVFIIVRGQKKKVNSQSKCNT